MKALFSMEMFRKENRLHFGISANLSFNKNIYNTYRNDVNNLLS